MSKGFIADTSLRKREYKMTVIHITLLLKFKTDAKDFSIYGDF